MRVNLNLPFRTTMWGKSRAPPAIGSANLTSVFCVLLESVRSSGSTSYQGYQGVLAGSDQHRLPGVGLSNAGLEFEVGREDATHVVRRPDRCLDAGSRHRDLRLRWIAPKYERLRAAPGEVPVLARLQVRQESPRTLRVMSCKLTDPPAERLIAEVLEFAKPGCSRVASTRSVREVAVHVHGQLGDPAPREPLPHVRALQALSQLSVRQSAR
jgi:hypothetical protein